MHNEGHSHSPSVLFPNILTKNIDVSIKGLSNQNKYGYAVT